LIPKSISLANVDAWTGIFYGIFYAIYFLSTGLHVVHILLGIVWNTGIALMSYGQFEDHMFAGRVEYAALYWHFVDIVWIFLFPALYLL